jgi:undecaprenyl diphosphate synthase
MTKGTKSVPGHIAVIMDGNGRWAKRRHLPRTMGHRAGIKAVREVVEECARIDGVEQLTLYSFSKENWRRPKREVASLMRLLRQFLVKERSNILENNIRFEVIGDVDQLPGEVVAEIDKTKEASRNNTGLTLCLALNYGSRAEITSAAQTIARRVSEGALGIDDITEETISSHLHTHGMRDPDLLIRTAGEMRISNFLLWQASYAEFWTTPKYWPDFRASDLRNAIADFGDRVRKFGGLGKKP